MQKISEMSWDEAKKYYKHNLNTLKTSIDVAQNATEEMNKIYSQVIKKANTTSYNKLQKFADLWAQKIDLDNMEDSLLIKNDYKKLIDEPSPRDFREFGQSLQQRVYRRSISNLDAYKDTMESFYDTWKTMWPYQSPKNPQN